MKQTNYHFSYTISINNSLCNVWQALIDVQNWPRWDTALKAAALNGHFEQAAKGTLTPQKGPTLSFYISELNTHRSYTFNTPLPIGELVIRRTLLEDNGVVHFTDDITFTGFLKFVFGMFLGRQFRKLLPGVMNNFKAIAERQ